MRQRSSVHLLPTVFTAVLGLSTALTPVLADEPPSWAPFEVCSENGRFCATVKAIDGNSETPWNQDYRLTMSERLSGGDREIWSMTYDYDGYSGGMVAPDGKTFVYVNYWFYPDSAVVRIYREGRQFGLTGAAFDIPESKLVDTVSHKLWLSQHRSFYAQIDENTLQIHTIDGKSHLIHLGSGNLEN